MSEAALPILAVAIGLVGIGLGAALIRASGADTRAGRRLAGARPASLPALQDQAAGDRLPTGPVRVEGRVRCANPLVTPDGDRLAALHRDVEVQLPDGRWRVIERLREARTIDLWERSASVRLELAELAEPLICIPRVWDGSPADLGDSYRPAVDRLAGEFGTLHLARATTRQVSLVDQLIVLAIARRDEHGRLRLEPPPGGFLATNVELDTAMRLLAGPRGTRMLAGFGVVLVGAVVALAGLIGVLLVLSG